jgi:hypothetical protein
MAPSAPPCKLIARCRAIVRVVLFSSVALFHCSSKYSPRVVAGQGGPPVYGQLTGQVYVKRDCPARTPGLSAGSPSGRGKSAPPAEQAAQHH